MEQVAVMIPTPVNNDELSDETESINLDLHVSDTEDSTESLKKCDVEANDQTESEEDILNKYIDDLPKKTPADSEEINKDESKSKLPNGILDHREEEYKKCNGTISPLADLEEADNLEETLVTEKDENLEGPLLEEKEDATKTKEDEESETKEDDEATKAIEDDVETRAIEDDEKTKAVEDDEETKEIEGDEETKAMEDNEETKAMEDNEETKTKEDAEKSNDVENTRTDKLKENDCSSTVLEEKSNGKKTCEEDDDTVKNAEDDSDKEAHDEMDVEKLEEEETKKSEDATKESENDTTNIESASTTPAKIALSRSASETKTDNENEDDDLLCVMDEKSVEEANENKDENSCSASEKDEETKENEENNTEEVNEESNGETNQETTEETNGETKEDEDTEVNSESQCDMDVDSSECAMDIEESDIGGVVYTDQNRDVSSERLNSSDSKIENDKDANKENEHDGDVTLKETSAKDDVPVQNVLTNGVAEDESKTDEEDMRGFDEEERNKETQKKTAKRQLSDTSNEGDSPKKIKLQSEEDKPAKEKRPIKLLESFKKFMLDKKLKKLTRFELEELCMQKMCECIVNKSEIGELRQKIMIQEQTIDTWRKEAIVVAKQTRDLKIVHERLMADLKVMKEQTGKPLVPVKITRSVGLQAIIETPVRGRPPPAPPIVNTTPVQQQRSPVVNTNQQNKPITPQNRQQQIKPKVQPQRATPTTNNRPLQVINQKDNVNNAKPRQNLISTPQQVKKNADPKTVIDLTDEDEKNQNAKQATNTASPTVRILNKQNVTVSSKSANTPPTSQASKIMFVTPNVLQRNSAVMVKMNSNGLISPQNGLTTIPNGQVSMVTSPAARTSPQVRVPISSVTTVRTAAVAKQIYKHPAPLPAAPIYQTTMPGKKPIPPKPHLNLTRSSCGTGIVLQWKMPYKLDSYETIVSYQLYAYQETKSPPKTDNWGKIGDVKALELPMAVTLTQFAVGNRYFFAVRAVDFQKRLGPFSDPENILL